MGSWDVRQDDLSISPFAFPGGRQPGPAFAGSSHAAGSIGQADRPFGAPWKTASRFADAISAGYPPPTKVFHSRELEEGLAGLVRHKAECGVFPTDEELRERGRVILGMERTAADEPALLEKFKEMIEREVGLGGAELGVGATGQGLGQVGSMLGPGATPEAAGRGQGSPVMAPGAGMGSGGAGAMGGLGVGGGGGLMMGIGAGLEMGSMAGLDMDMDLAGDMNNALMQDMNFDFVFDTPDATMGGPE